MKAHVRFQNQWYQVDFENPVDISLPIDAQAKGPNAFYADRPRFQPYQSGNFIASVRQGGAVNSYDVTFNPHGNGTHTECQGHITEEWEKITDVPADGHMFAQLISVKPQKINGDQVITLGDLRSRLDQKKETRGLVIRTQPNGEDKKNKKYSGTNPPYVSDEAMAYIVERGVEHLLIDLPSVDKEQDGGKVASHHVFWNLPSGGREACTITELIYVPDDIVDGLYFLDLQRVSFVLDCSPSRPLLYEVKRIDDEHTTT